MKKILPLLLFVVLAVVAYRLWRGDRGTTLSADMADFVVADTAKVDRIFIALTDGTSADLRRTSTGWTVNGLPARQRPVSSLLETFRRVEVRSPIPESMRPNVLKWMATGGRKIEIYEGGNKPSKIWWLGTGTPDHNGTYALLEKPGMGRSQLPLVIGVYGFTGVLYTRFHTFQDDWRSQQLTYYPDMTKVQRVQVEHPQLGTGGFTVELGGKPPVVKDQAGTVVPFDTLALRTMLRTVGNGRFEEIVRKLPGVERDSILRSPPLHVITITSDQGTQRIPFWARNPRPGQLDMVGQQQISDPNRLYALQGDSLMLVAQYMLVGHMLPTLDRIQGH